MTDPIDDLISRTAKITESLVDVVRAAYDAGFRDGGLTMRDHILRAANSPVSIKAGSVESVAREGSGQKLTTLEDIPTVWRPTAPAGGIPTPHERRVSARAPRGLVRKAVEEVLAEAPGLTIVEVEQRVGIRYPQVARKSVGNQLRAFEGELYRREGKYNWFLIGHDAQKEAAKPDNSDFADILGSEERR